MKNRLFTTMKKIVLGAMLCVICFIANSMQAEALSLSFDKETQEIIVAGVPATDNTYNYSVNGNLYYGDTLVESFCYGTASVWYDIPDAQAYIFSYDDIEFILPASGTYKMNAWIETRDLATWTDLGKSQKTSLTFYYQKKDESTNWGPGLPETMVEDWEIAELEGKDKDMVVSGGTEENPYTWTIHGTDITSVPPEEENVNLEIKTMDARFEGMPGQETTSIKLDIAHNGSFGFTARLDLTLHPIHAGKYANLFYIIEPGKYEYVQSCIIDANGVATFYLDHASSYMVVISDKEYTGETIIEPVAEPVEPVKTENTATSVDQTAETAQAGADGVAGDTQEDKAAMDETDDAAGTNGTAENTADSLSADETTDAEDGAGNDADSSNIAVILGIIVAVVVIAVVAVVFFLKKKKEV